MRHLGLQTLLSPGTRSVRQNTAPGPESRKAAVAREGRCGFAGAIPLTRLAAGAALLVYFCGSSAGAQEFQAEGQLRQRIFLKAELRHELKKHFALSVRGCDWLIRTDDPGTGDYAERAFEGGTIYSLYVFNVASNGVSSKRQITRLENAQVPDDDVSLINYLWLAYASACYFGRLTNAALEPIWQLDDRNLRAEGFTMKGDWSLNKGSPRLPQWVTYISDGLYRTQVRGRRAVFPVPKPFQLGYTNAVYQASSLTSIGALAVPLEFSFATYYIEGTNLLPRTLTEGVAHRIAAGAATKHFRPQYAGMASTHDLRFSHSDKPVRSLVYESSNSLWLEMTALTNQYLAKLQRNENAKRYSTTQKRVARYRILFLAGFLASSICFILAMRARRSR